MKLQITLDCNTCLGQVADDNTLTEATWPHMTAIDKNENNTQLYECKRCGHSTTLTLEIS